MKIFIAGASGVLGRRMLKQFVARGHSAIGLVRSMKAETAVREAGGEPTSRCPICDAMGFSGYCVCVRGLGHVSTVSDVCEE